MQFVYSKAVMWALESYEANQQDIELAASSTITEAPGDDASSTTTFIGGDILKLPEIYGHLPSPAKARLKRRVLRRKRNEEEAAAAEKKEKLKEQRRKEYLETESLMSEQTVQDHGSYAGGKGKKDKHDKFPKLGTKQAQGNKTKQSGEKRNLSKTKLPPLPKIKVMVSSH